jgi:MFS family permease
MLVTVSTLASSPSRDRRLVVCAMASATGGAILPFLTGAVSVQLGADLGISPARLGATISAFFLVAFLTSAVLGRLVDHLGWRRATLLAAVANILVLLALPSLARSGAALTTIVAFGGIVHAVAMPASNVALLSELPAERHAVSFGIKQCAMPAAGLLAGAALPLIALPFGWWWAYRGAAIVPAIALIALLGLPTRGSLPARVKSRTRIVDPWALAITTIGGALGATVVGVIGAFYVRSAVDVGLSEAHAGTLMAVGSGLGIATRLIGGWVTSRRRSDGVIAVATLMAIGAFGCVLLASSRIPVLLLGTVLAFGAGWGWSGLFHFAVVRANPDAPATATGIILTGLSGGSTVGPSAFGYMTDHADASLAWVVIGATALVGAGLVYFGASTMGRRHGAPRGAV